MLVDNFEKIFDAAVAQERETLVNKAKEYAPDGADRFANFRRGAEMLRTSPEETAWAYMVKHLVSIEDLVLGRSKFNSRYYVREKIGDARNYLLLIEALLGERIQSIENNGIGK
jgi:hypothetical protein